jgi:hypothetical protein
MTIGVTCQRLSDLGGFYGLGVRRYLGSVEEEKITGFIFIRNSTKS